MRATRSSRPRAHTHTKLFRLYLTLSYSSSRISSRCNAASSLLRLNSFSSILLCVSRRPQLHLPPNALSTRTERSLIPHRSYFHVTLPLLPVLTIARHLDRCLPTQTSLQLMSPQSYKLYHEEHTTRRNKFPSSLYAVKLAADASNLRCQHPIKSK